MNANVMSRSMEENRWGGRSHRVGFRYAANTRLREACMWWAYNSLKESPWGRQAYDQARERKQHHHRALRGLGARWMRVLHRAWLDGVPYDPAKHLGDPDTATGQAAEQRPPPPPDPPRRTPARHDRRHAGRRHARNQQDPQDRPTVVLTVGVCRVHFMRNVLAKVSKGHAEMVRRPAPHRASARTYSSKSGTAIEPSSANGNPGLYAISQACPSGSVKYPAYPP